MPRALAYVWVSSDEQTKGFRLEIKREKIEGFARSEGSSWGRTLRIPASRGRSGSVSVPGFGTWPSRMVA